MFAPETGFCKCDDPKRTPPRIGDRSVRTKCRRDESTVSAPRLFPGYYCSNGFQSLKNRTAMTGERRVQINPDELSRFIGDSRRARGRAYPERILGSAVS